MYCKWLFVGLAALVQTGCGVDNGQSVPEPVGGVIAVRPAVDLGNEPVAASVTRADGSLPLIYTLEAWTRGEEACCVLHRTVTGTLDEASFEIALVPGEYDFLFWADYGTAYYQTSDLSQVSIAMPYLAGAERDAFAGRMEGVVWNGGNNVRTTLRRPLAKITVSQTEPAGSAEAVSMTYRGLCTVYDVRTGTVSVPLETLEVTYPQTAVGAALVAEDFLFVPDARQLSLDVSVGGGTQSLEDVPLSVNYRTNITASF